MQCHRHADIAATLSSPGSIAQSRAPLPSFLFYRSLPYIQYKPGRLDYNPPGCYFTRPSSPAFARWADTCVAAGQAACPATPCRLEAAPQTRRSDHGTMPHSGA